MSLQAPYYDDGSVTIYRGDALDVMAELEPGSVQCCVTSPPYFGLRRYAGQQEHTWGDGIICAYGAEPTVDCGRPFSKLRDDLTEKERDYVLAELRKCGLIQ